MTWTSGQPILVQEVWADRVWAARPMAVVEDQGQWLALWYPKGTRWKAPTSPSSRPRAATRGERLATALARGDWVFVDAVWDVDTLVLVAEGDWHAIWVSWLDGGVHWGWYVNLQHPYRRTSCGLETMDYALDVIVDVDRAWRWKDEDELEMFVEHRVFDRELAQRLRDEGLAVARRAERNEPPFDANWPQWRPDPSWGRPELPAGWDRLCR
jgi:uncharacterized protein DUF402